MDCLVRGIARAADLRVLAAVTTGVVAEGARRHGTDPAATCALGRALTSGLLLATLTKGGERVTVQLVGDGPIGSITVDANDAGDARGYVLHPKTGLRVPTGRGSLGDVLGRNGVVNILRDLGLNERYQGQVALTTGEIDEDVEAYLRQSEQVPSALGCEVVLDKEGQLVAAGGLLVQALPGGDPASVREVQHALRTGDLYRLLAGGERSPRVLAERLYPTLPLEWMGADRPVRFWCTCSSQRIEDMLALLDKVDLDELIAEDRPADVTCNFCGEHYQVQRDVLERIRLRIAGPRQSN
jgi:molecular chaperone Hsp33